MIKRMFNQSKILEEIQKKINNGESVETILEIIDKIDIDKSPNEVINMLHFIVESLLKKILNNKYHISQNIKLYHKEYPQSLINIETIKKAVKIRNNMSHNGLVRDKVSIPFMIETYSLYIKFIAQEANIDLKSFVPPHISNLKELFEEDDLEEKFEKKSKVKYGLIPLVMLLSFFIYNNFNDKIIFLAGTEDGTYHTMAQQLKERYDDSIEVVSSKGSVDNLKILGEKKLIGFGLIQEDVLKEFAKEAIEGQESQKNILKNISLLNTILNEEVHILVRDDSSMSSFQDIENKTIAIGSEKSGNAITAQSIYTKLFHKRLENRRYYQSFSKSLYALKYHDVDAIILVGGEPLLKLQKSLKGVKLLSYKKEKALQGYLIGQISQHSYPWITSEVRTLMVRSFLVTNLSEKKNVVILPILEKLKKSIENNKTSNIHPKWKEFTSLKCLPTPANGIIYHSATRFNSYCPKVKQIFKNE